MSVARLFSLVIGTTVDLFYRRRLLEGENRVPRRGPVLLVANHPNALVDPIVVQNAVGRRARLLAKSTLWKMPGISLLVRGMESLPVYRAKDGGDTSQNAETFRAVEQALVDGSAVLIFPEGISHNQPSVQPLKTGAARIALGALGQGARELVVIPVGLSYADKLRFRSTAAVEVGVPIRVADFQPIGPGDDEARSAVKELTAAIAAGLRQVTLNLEQWEDLPLLEAIDAIWRQEDPERTRRLKTLADGISLLRQRDPERIEDLRARLSDWLLRLKRMGLRAQDVAEGAMRARKDPIKLASFALRNLLASVVALPFAVLGSLFWSVPFWIVHLIFILWRAERDVGATVKVLASAVIFPLWYAFALTVLSRHLEPSMVLLAAAVTPMAGMMTRHFFRRRFYAARQLLTFLRLGSRGQLLDPLLDERDAFCREFDEVARSIG